MPDCIYSALSPISHQDANAAIPSRRIPDGCTSSCSIYHSTYAHIVRTAACAEMPSSLDVHIARQVTLFSTVCSICNLIRHTSDITGFIPHLVAIMTPAPGSGFDHSAFAAASDVLQEIMTRSSLAGGAGTSTLTEPLLVWLNEYADHGEPLWSSTLILHESLRYLIFSRFSRRCLAFTL